MFSASIGTARHEGYVPRDLGIGGGDYLEFDLCLECGKVEGEWPLPQSKLEKKLNGRKGGETEFGKEFVALVRNDVGFRDLLLKLTETDDVEMIADGLSALCSVKHRRTSMSNQMTKMANSLLDELDEWDKFAELCELLGVDPEVGFEEDDD